MINTVCLCGSTRFMDHFNTANIELTSRGLSVITISMNLSRDDKGDQQDAALKNFLDLVHLNKILRADAAFIVGVPDDIYIGHSTAREILWANMQGKPCLEQRASWDSNYENIRYGGNDLSLVTKAKKVLGLIPALKAI